MIVLQPAESTVILAYIDPGTGVLIIQVAIAGAIGGLFALRAFWGRVRHFVSVLLSRKNNKDD